MTEEAGSQTPGLVGPPTSVSPKPPGKEIGWYLWSHRVQTQPDWALYPNTWCQVFSLTWKVMKDNCKEPVTEMVSTRWKGTRCVYCTKKFLFTITW